jgi:hypothetical protein
LLHGTHQEIVDSLIDSGHYDLVVHGHSHRAEIIEGKTLVVNPGGGMWLSHWASNSCADRPGQNARTDSGAMITGRSPVCHSEEPQATWQSHWPDSNLQSLVSNHGLVTPECCRFSFRMSFFRLCQYKEVIV